MTERRIFAILGFLLALVAGLLLILAALDFGRSVDLDTVVRHIIGLVLGIAAILGGVMMYKGPRMTEGGIVTIVIGVLVIVLGQGFEAAILLLVAGVLGLVGTEAR